MNRSQQGLAVWVGGILGAGLGTVVASFFGQGSTFLERVASSGAIMGVAAPLVGGITGAIVTSNAVIRPCF